MIIKGSHVLTKAHAADTQHSAEHKHTHKKYLLVYYALTFEKQPSVSFLNVNVCGSGI